jgi:hypothetical protein
MKLCGLSGDKQKKKVWNHKIVIKDECFSSSRVLHYKIDARDVIRRRIHAYIDANKNHWNGWINECLISLERV